MDRAEAPVNVYEGGGQISVVVPIPGAHAEHTRVVVEPRRITVEAVCKYAQEQQQYLRRDWQVGAWHADIGLPVGVDPAAAHASLNLGVLVVMAPVSESASGRSTPAVS
jgi:HSP20 family molecular chaperone IbpA